MKTVQVLMSTYNGEQYIREQIDTILKQEGVDVRLFIRDDGSTDSTIKIIRQYEEEYQNIITVSTGSNLGFANSFMFLVDHCENYEFYAFADQDDIWEPNKLISAINKINIKEPALYASNLLVFNTAEKRKYLLYDEGQKNEILHNLNEHCYMFNPYGCTMVWNHALQEQLRLYEKPNNQTHDVWVNLVAHYTGKTYFDFNSYINYRVHGKNACGATPKSLIGKIKKYYKFYFIDGKQLNISSSCLTIDKLFPDKSNEYIHSFALYKTNIVNKFKAFYNIGKLDIGNSAKRKFRILILFNKF